MQNGPKTIMNTHQSKSTTSFGARSKRWKSNGARDKPKDSQNAQRNYERYLALAQAEILAGDIVGAEYYYQHAEHYFRSMSSDPGTT
jgi:hypothetical protein